MTGPECRSACFLVSSSPLEKDGLLDLLAEAWTDFVGSVEPLAGPYYDRSLLLVQQRCEHMQQPQQYSNTHSEMDFDSCTGNVESSL